MSTIQNGASLPALVNRCTLKVAMQPEYYGQWNWTSHQSTWSKRACIQVASLSCYSCYTNYTAIFSVLALFELVYVYPQWEACSQLHSRHTLRNATLVFLPHWANHAILLLKSLHKLFFSQYHVPILFTTLPSSPIHFLLYPLNAPVYLLLYAVQLQPCTRPWKLEQQGG